jgi:hypothetical protein
VGERCVFATEAEAEACSLTLNHELGTAKGELAGGFWAAEERPDGSWGVEFHEREVSAFERVADAFGRLNAPY